MKCVMNCWIHHFWRTCCFWHKIRQYAISLNSVNSWNMILWKKPERLLNSWLGLEGNAIPKNKTVHLLSIHDTNAAFSVPYKGLKYNLCIPQGGFQGRMGIRQNALEKLLWKYTLRHMPSMATPRGQLPSSPPATYFNWKVKKYVIERYKLRSLQSEHHMKLPQPREIPRPITFCGILGASSMGVIS